MVLILAFTFNVNLPFKSVTVPCPLPFAMTDAPIMASPLLSVTVPVIVLDCAISIVPENSKKVNMSKVLRKTVFDFSMS